MQNRPIRPIELLLVEDDAVDREAVQRALVKLKIANSLHIAHDGIEALEKLRSGTVKTPVIILLDINMPRMNGLEFLRELRKDPDHAHHIVFVLTTSGDQKSIFDAYNLNVQAYMLKSNVGDGFIHALELIERYWRVVEIPD
ncbi:MAG: response regulator [Pseudomonadota bacterium]